ncbi:hypothetical protein, partial [Loigolactobacillus backii]|uniref:hypothetical protein n=1 Tax=Loigolactobacillus backii TaxID=375175 RepID=UPI001CDBBAB0
VKDKPISQFREAGLPFLNGRLFTAYSQITIYIDLDLQTSNKSHSILSRAFSKLFNELNS